VGAWLVSNGWSNVALEARDALQSTAARKRYLAIERRSSSPPPSPLVRNHRVSSAIFEYLGSTSRLVGASLLVLTP